MANVKCLMWYKAMNHISPHVSIMVLCAEANFCYYNEIYIYSICIKEQHLFLSKMKKLQKIEISEINVFLL